MSRFSFESAEGTGQRHGYVWDRGSRLSLRGEWQCRDVEAGAVVARYEKGGWMTMHGLGSLHVDVQAGARFVQLLLLSFLVVQERELRVSIEAAANAVGS